VHDVSRQDREVVAVAVVPAAQWQGETGAVALDAATVERQRQAVRWWPDAAGREVGRRWRQRDGVILAGRSHRALVAHDVATAQRLAPVVGAGAADEQRRDAVGKPLAAAQGDGCLPGLGRAVSEGGRGAALEALAMVQAWPDARADAPATDEALAGAVAVAIAPSKSEKESLILKTKSITTVTKHPANRDSQSVIKTTFRNSFLPSLRLKYLPISKAIKLSAITEITSKLTIKWR